MDDYLATLARQCRGLHDRLSEEQQLCPDDLASLALDKSHAAANKRCRLRKQGIAVPYIGREAITVRTNR